jgi:hypothetical protein
LKRLGNIQDEGGIEVFVADEVDVKVEGMKRYKPKTKKKETLYRLCGGKLQRWIKGGQFLPNDGDSGKERTRAPKGGTWIDVTEIPKRFKIVTTTKKTTTTTTTQEKKTTTQEKKSKRIGPYGGYQNIHLRTDDLPDMRFKENKRLFGRTNM